MRLAIVGSQAKNFNIRQQGDAIELIDMIIGFYYRQYEDLMEGLEFVSGGADGVDQWAEHAADSWNVGKVIYLPKTRNWEGFRSRNVLIAERCTSLYAIRSTTSTTYGSGWTADCAEKLGKEVHRYYV